MFFYAMLLETIGSGVVLNTDPSGHNPIKCTREHGTGYVVFNHLRDICCIRTFFQCHIYEYRKLHNVFKRIQPNDGLRRDFGWNINFL